MTYTIFKKICLTNRKKKTAGIQGAHIDHIELITALYIMCFFSIILILILRVYKCVIERWCSIKL